METEISSRQETLDRFEDLCGNFEVFRGALEKTSQMIRRTLRSTIVFAGVACGVAKLGAPETTLAVWAFAGVSSLSALCCWSEFRVRIILRAVLANTRAEITALLRDPCFRPVAKEAGFDVDVIT